MSSAILAVVLFTVCLATGLQAQSSPYKSCDKVANPIDFRMTGCTEAPCKLYRGESATAEWDWEVSAATNKLKPKVTAKVWGILNVDYDIGQENACDTLRNAVCPLDEGEVVTYALKMPVLASYPKIGLTIELALIDDNGVAQVCFQVEAQVADRP